MKKIPQILVGLLLTNLLFAQKIPTPDIIYGELFKDVQLSRIFPDNKTFVDCVPKRDAAAIVKDYMDIKKNPAIRFSLKLFIEENFEIPKPPATKYETKEQDVTAHIKNLWTVLKREKDKSIAGSSLLPLPYPYIVPGGRFREIYYWDSYFTMLGLRESGENEMIENMVKNFSYLISTYGHIPNGNRSYYLSRSQPPFFSLMLDLLAEIKGKQVYVLFQPALQKEYDYWMDKTAATKHVVKMPDGSFLNRYYDQNNTPRQESYAEDVEVSKKSTINAPLLNLRLRSGAESGWDFSSRWFADGKNLSTIQTTLLVPVDLNSLLYHLEKTLETSYTQSGELLQARAYKRKADKRKEAINKYCWSEKNGWYTDYHISNKALSPEMTLAGMSPFFLNIADKGKMDVAKKQLEQFMKPGGVVATLKNTGQQWDAPNGWAPLEWMTITGLENYDQHDLAKNIAEKWVALNIKVFKNTGKLMEKYNVENTGLEAGGGEYPSQDGFGWTNGVLLALMKKYNIKQTQ